MASKYLGRHIDIHMGGVDHIPVHHTNEIAQSEACFSDKWVNYWLHCEFLVLDKAKMSKSSGNFIKLADLPSYDVKPIHYRYFCLGAHYRSPLHFSDGALSAAKRSFDSLYNLVVSWKLSQDRAPKEEPARLTEHKERFWAAAFNDFNVPAALGVLWAMARDESLSAPHKFAAVRGVRPPAGARRRAVHAAGAVGGAHAARRVARDRSP